MSVMISPRKAAAAEVWSKKLRALRKKRRISQTEAAKLAGISRRTWIAWENKHYVPSDLTQQAIRNIFPDLK